MPRKSLIKIVISVLMLAVVFRLADLDTLYATILAIPLSWALLVVFGYVLGQLMSSYKWWIIARSGGVHASYLNTLKAYFIGSFVNCFGLGIVGGDVARGILLGNETDKRPAAFASVIADRAQGLAVLSLIGTITVLVAGRQNLEPSFFYLLSTLGVLLVLGWFIGPWILLKIIPANHRFRGAVEQLSSAFPKDGKTILLITVISLCFHLLQIGLHWVMGMSVGVYIPLTQLLITIPFVNIVSSFPISWNGLGVRENAYLFFLATQGIITKEQAIAFGAMWILSVTVSSAIGGIFAFISKDLDILRKERANEEARVHSLSA